MSPTYDRPDDRRGVGIDTPVDRRRPGRPASVSPGLIPLLRGQIDPDAPPDPVLPKSGQLTVDAELLSGAMLVMALAVLGVLVRFVA